MKIQWSSETARDVLERLKRADQGMANATQQAGIVRAAMTEANAQRDNRVLNELSEQFENCVRRMNALEQALEDFERGVQQAQTVFEDAERMLVDRANNLPLPTALSLSGGMATSGRDGRYFSLPEMRINAMQGPDWLQRVTRELL